MRGAFIKKHETRRSPTDRRGGNITDAHGWVFSRIVYSCSAAYRLVLMRRRRNGSDFFACGRCVAERKICGNPRDLWATTKRTRAKAQAGCIYSPTDLSDKHRCHAGCLSITQIAPSARQIDTDFSHAENLSMRARFNGYAPRGQKFIAQGKRSDALGIMCRGICTL